jgi:dolichol-phosphate mannosyltransferase
MTKPIYIFGGFGLGSLFLSFLCWGLALVLKIVPAGDFLFGVELHKNLIRTPLPLLGSVFFLVGIVMILQGLLAEVVIRTYYESQGKRAYVIGVIRDRRPARAPAP